MLIINFLITESSFYQIRSHILTRLDNSRSASVVSKSTMLKSIKYQRSYTDCKATASLIAIVNSLQVRAVTLNTFQSVASVISAM